MIMDNQKFGRIVMPPLEKIRQKLSKTGAWVWEHKKWVIVALVTTAGVILVVKNRDGIKELLRYHPKNRLAAKSAVNTIAEECEVSIPADVLKHRTGIMLTATKLGGKVGVSNREINRRLVDAGLAVRLPCGEYILTEQGKLLGESGLKVTRWNYTVPLVQWDEAVLEIIFTPEELAAVTERRKHIQEILSKASV